MANHSLEHALSPAETNCRHLMQEISVCVICGKSLKTTRKDIDTCGKRCLKTLLNLQRRMKND